MHKINPNQRVLALDVRPRFLGYAVFEGAETLRDWGVKNFRVGVNAARIPFRTRIANLLSEWQPEMVVVKRPRNGRVRRKLIIIEELAKARHIPGKVIGKDELREVFAGKRNKYERARALVGSFPELSDRLPRKRKPWQSEDPRMGLFDAASVGAAYFEKFG